MCSKKRTFYISELPGIIALLQKLLMAMQIPGIGFANVMAPFPYSNKTWSFIVSVAEGLKSLKVREKELEILRANEESRQSRFSLRKPPVECNSQHEANAIVLARWAADEQHFMALPLGDPQGQSEDGDNPGGEHNASANNKGTWTVG